MSNMQALDQAPRGGRRSLPRVVGMLAVVGGLVMFAAASTAGAQVGILPVLIRSTPSDPRATFHEGNVTTCTAAGFPGTIQMGSPSNTNASDANVAGTVAPNAGTIQPGVGQEVNITVTNPNAVVDAVVVKGADGYNVYPNPAAPPPILPPALPPPQHYISPLTGHSGSGPVPNISHWFVCYHLTTPPPVGSLTVDKIIIPPVAPPGTPLPLTFTALVTCSNGTTATVTIGAGRALGSTITGLPIGKTCTVVEQTTGTFPPGTVVSYDPAGADTPPGVTIGDATGVVVTITNDFSGLTPQSGNLRLVKALLPGPPGLTLPASYTAQVVCDDGTNASVTLPGGGGDGTPLVSVAADSVCAVGEDNTSLPAGWVLTYSVNGGAATSSPPVFTVTANATVTVTITNDPSAVAVPTTAPPSTPEPTIAPTMPATLPPTGADSDTPLILGVVLVAVGLAAVGYTTRRRAHRP